MQRFKYLIIQFVHFFGRGGQVIFLGPTRGGEGFFKVKRGGGEAFFKLENERPDQEFPSSIAWPLTKRPHSRE